MNPRIRIAHLPTAVEPLPRLGAMLGGPRLLVKRDDQTGLAFGGNKTRKLEFILAEAQANGAKTLVTAGGIQSNHCRQTAALAARYGLTCILVLNGDESEMPTGNLFLDHLLGAQIVWTTRQDRDVTLRHVFEEAWANGQRPYLIPVGGSNPTGALGYVYAFEELMVQDIHPDWIVVATSSGGTQAGLALGARRAGWEGRLLGISIDAPERDIQEKVADLASSTSERVGPRMRFEPQDILVNADYLGQGYALMGKLEEEAIELFARSEGLILGPVYTARAAGGMIDLIRKRFFKSGETVLFWHTGGTPEIFAYPYTGQILKTG